MSSFTDAVVDALVDDTGALKAAIVDLTRELVLALERESKLIKALGGVAAFAETCRPVTRDLILDAMAAGAA